MTAVPVETSDWAESWAGFIAAKKVELAKINAWIAEKMPAAHGHKAYEIVGNDPLLTGLLAQRGIIERDISDALRYIQGREC